MLLDSSTDSTFLKQFDDKRKRQLYLRIQKRLSSLLTSTRLIVYFHEIGHFCQPTADKFLKKNIVYNIYKVSTCYIKLVDMNIPFWLCVWGTFVTWEKNYHVTEQT